jgi:hypothetical protein
MSAETSPPRLAVFVEGLTESEVDAFRLKAEALVKVEGKEIAEARRSSEEVKDGDSARARVIANGLTELIEKHRAEMLALGAVARPLAEGLVEVKALEDANTLARGKPR